MSGSLFETINNLSEGQQIALLKRLHKGVLTSHLFKLIIDLSEEQQIYLLDQLQGMATDDTPETTIDLDERESPRKPCTIAVEFATEDLKYSSTILDISMVGVFIETDELLDVGQSLTLKLSSSDSKETLEVNGEIIWRNPKGIGVKFTDLSPYRQHRLKSFVSEI